MKKNNKNKKLPRYDIGTMKRLPLGYLQPKGIGQTTFSVEQGYSIDPETRALRANRIPNAINQAQQSFLYPMLILLNGTKTAVTPTVGSLLSLSIASTMASAPGLASVPLNTVAQTSSLANTLASTTGGKLLSGGGMLAAQKAAQTSSNIGSTAATSAGINTLGAVAGGVGTALGGLTMANQISNAGSHRTASDMQKTVSKSIYTTAGGNQYELYGTVNASPELAYENEMRKLKQLGFGINAIGTGASLGAMLGSLGALGSIGGPLGMGIGAGVGLLAGGLASLFGFGDNEEEIKDEIRRENDALSRLNMMALAVGKTKDLETRAANGKMPGFHNGKANARVSNGEVIGNFEDGYFRVPGSKNNKDGVKTHLGKKDFVISNKHGLSDYAWLTGDIPGALAALSYLQKTGLMNKYKNGKLPKFSSGSKIADYSSAVLPHFWGFMTNLALKNRDKYADSYVPEMEISNPEAIKAYNQVMSDMIDPTQYLNMSLRNYNQAAWNARRAVNAGYGGRMLMLDSLYRGKQLLDAETLMKINEMNRAQRNIGANLLNQYGTDKLAKRYDQFWKRVGVKQQLNAARDYALRTDDLNMYKMWAAAANAYDAVNKYHLAYDIQNKQIGIWQLGANTDRMKALADIQRLGASDQYNATTQKPYIPTSMLLGIGKKYQFLQPSYLNIMDDEYWNLNGRRFIS